MNNRKPLYIVVCIAIVFSIVVWYSFLQGSRGVEAPKEADPKDEVSLWADGNDWLFKYNEQQRVYLMRLIFRFLKVDIRKFPLDYGVKALNYYYYRIAQEAEKGNEEDYADILDLKCVQIIREIVLELKE